MNLAQRLKIASVSSRLDFRTQEAVKELEAPMHAERKHCRLSEFLGSEAAALRLHTEEER
jgi:hypothetical protein